MDGWNTTFLLGRPIGAMLVSGRVSKMMGFKDVSPFENGYFMGIYVQFQGG